MRRLILPIGKTFATLLVGAVLTLCSLGVFSAYTNNVSQQIVSCNSSCHTHGQPTAINGQQNENKEDDKEPTPPLSAWLQIPINLALLYLVPVFGVLWFVYKQREIHLTTQLRM